MEAEQITKEPEKKVERIEDPKKVVALKRIAKENKKAKQAVEEQSDGENSRSGLIPQMNLTAAIGIASILLTAAGLYLQYGRPKVEPKPLKREPERQFQQKPVMRIGME